MVLIWIFIIKKVNAFISNINLTNISNLRKMRAN